MRGHTSQFCYFHSAFPVWYFVLCILGGKPCTSNTDHSKTTTCEIQSQGEINDLTLTWDFITKTPHVSCSFQSRERKMERNDGGRKRKRANNLKTNTGTQINREKWKECMIRVSYVVPFSQMLIWWSCRMTDGCGGMFLQNVYINRQDVDQRGVTVHWGSNRHGAILQILSDKLVQTSDGLHVTWWLKKKLENGKGKRERKQERGQGRRKEVGLISKRFYKEGVEATDGSIVHSWCLWQ